MNLKTEQRYLRWLEFFFFTAMVYGIGFYLRYIEYKWWLQPYFFINGEPLMATHDAYAWLSGAIKTGVLYGKPMSNILYWLHNVTGLNIAKIAFWLPALVAPLVCVPVFIIAKLFGHLKSGLIGGAIASIGVGYFLRTRLGYADTDILTGTLPLLYCASLIFWLQPYFFSWVRKENKVLPDQKESLFKATGVGLILAFYNWFYPNAYPIMMYSYLFILFLVLVFTTKEVFWALLPEFGLILIYGFGKEFGFGLALVVTICLYYLSNKKGERLKSLYSIFFFMLGIGVLLWAKGTGAVTLLIEPVLGYAKIFSTLPGYKIHLPDVKASIKEAQDVSWEMLISRMGLNPFFFYGGLVGYILACIRYPLLLVLLPQLALSLLSIKLGSRFTMYGPPVIGIGLGLGLGLGLEYFKLKQEIIKLGIYFLLFGFIFLFGLHFAQRLRPYPVLPKEYASSFIELSQKAEPNAQLWQWWDYGYAEQYYAKRKSFGDGGRQNGPYLYPLAVVHTTDSPLQASQIMKFIAITQEEQIKQCLANGTKPVNPGAKILYWPVNPVQKLEDMGPKKAELFIDSLKAKFIIKSKPANPQYLVLSWENLRLSYWITYFGSWDLFLGRGRHGMFQQIRGNVQINPKIGILLYRDRTIPIKKMLIIKKNSKKPEEKEWANFKGIYLIYNQYSQELYAVDGLVYNSMLVQMLLKNPTNFNPFFSLVIDHYPWVRIYKVN